MDTKNRELFEMGAQLFQLQDQGYDVDRMLNDGMRDQLAPDIECYRKGKIKKIQEERISHAKANF